MENSNVPFNIACTPPNHEMGDDIGAILKDLGLDYREVKIRHLEDPYFMEKLDILFINCPGPEPTWRSANNVRDFVERGGALYVSCYARKWIDLIFPGIIEFHSDGEVQDKLLARVVDWQLREYLGGIDELYLRYNTHWHGIKRILAKNELVHEYLRGTRAGWFEEEPLLVSFPYEKGFVIFTTFHNSSQVNALEYKLLEFLVIRPLMEKKIAQSREIMAKQNYSALKEYLGALSVGEQSRMYEYYNDEYADLKFVFNWKGKATVRIVVLDQKEKQIFNKNVRESPFEFDLKTAPPGLYYFKMQIVDAPLKKFPYIIQVGRKDVVEMQLEMTEQTVIQSFPKKKNDLQGQQQPMIGPDNVQSDLGQPSFPEPYMSSGKEHRQDRDKPINLFDQPIRKKNIPQKRVYLMDFRSTPNFNKRVGRTLNIEIISPSRVYLGKFDFTYQKEVIIAKSDLIEYLDEKTLDENTKGEIICKVQLADEINLGIENPNNFPIFAGTFNGDYENLKEIEPNGFDLFGFPVVLRINSILLGFYF